MSETYYIGCKNCNKSLWIGQGTVNNRRYLYNGKENIEKLEQFLFSHENHELVFGGLDYLDSISDFEDEEEVEAIKKIINGSQSKNKAPAGLIAEYNTSCPPSVT